MKPLAFALLFAVPFAAPAHAGLTACEYRSDFDLRIEPSALAFHRDGAPPIEIRDGRLFVDAREIALDAADRARVRRYEATIRTLVPEVKAIATDAVGIATEAVLQVAATFSGRDDAATRTRVRELAGEMTARIADSRDSADWNDAAFQRMVAEFTAELVPMLVADAAAIALKAALTGDEAAARELEARTQQMERELEAGVERRAKRLEARAEALCPRLAELDALEGELQARVGDAHALDLLRRQ